MFDQLLGNHFYAAAIILLVAALFGRVLKFIFTRIIRRLVSKTETHLDDRIIDVLGSRATTISILVGFGLALQEVRKALSPEQLTANQVIDYAGIIVFVVLVFVLARLASRLLETVFEWYMDEMSKKASTNITATIAPLMNKIINVVLFLVAIIIVLDDFGINIGSLLVSLGVGSLAIALAAQDTLANMIAGFVIMVDRPFRVGDRIQLPTGEVGDVNEIGLRSTKILNFDNNLLVIPNAELIKRQIVNYSYPTENIRVVVEVNIAYDSDVARAKEIVLSLAGSHPDVGNSPAPEIFLVNFADSAMQLKLFAKTDDYRKKFKIEADLREQILRSFAKAGIEIPYPRRVVQVLNSDVSQAAESKKSL